MKRAVCAALIIIAIMFDLMPAASAAFVSYDEAEEVLLCLGLCRGGDSGTAPNRAPTRAETLVMLTRLIGCENEAREYEGRCPFDDAVGKWYESYAAYGYIKSLCAGVDEKTFAGDRASSLRDYLTFVLRALGYSENSDFTWEKSVEFSDSIGLTHGEYKNDSQFLRRDMILISYTALTLDVKDGSGTLAEKLYRTGCVSFSDLVKTRLAGYVNCTLREFSPAEIYERSSSAVFLLKVYKNADASLEDDQDARASGFFITSDGEALISYHSIDEMRSAWCITSDGHAYPLAEVLYADPLQDMAVVRISMTDTDGYTVPFFPYIEMGDSDAVSVGDAVYAIGAPLGLEGTFSAGVVSARKRIVDDPAYPCIQFTAQVSPGSSGGAVLDRFGRAIGIVMGMYNNGNDLNVCIPVNCVADVPLTGHGESLSDMCDRIDSLKENAVLMCEPTKAVVDEGETVELVISSDCPVQLQTRFSLVGGDRISAEWGRFITKRSVILRVTGVKAGKATVKVSFLNGCGEDGYFIEIPVRVVN